jgi:transposase-like protein
MNAQGQSISASLHTSKEGYKNVAPWFHQLKANGLQPLVITMDGEISVIRAIREIWPQTKIQRCLYHIQREGLRWLRSFPKTQAGRELRALLSTLASIKSFKDRDIFLALFHSWINAHYLFIKALPNTTVAFKDLKKTVTLIKNALPDMFHYLDDSNVPSTTNALEGFFSRLKSDYQRHRGLSQRHRINYLDWYCYLKNNPSSTNF